MKLVTFRRPGQTPGAGVVSGERVISLAGAGYPDLMTLLALGDEARARVENWVYNPPAEAVAELASVKLLAPVPRPNKLICVGLNYRDHAIESNMELPKVPTIFNKFATSVIGPGDNIVLPAVSSQPDYEAEFAFVIGRGGRNIPADRWKDHVFGYTLLNDVSARDYQLATSQWLMGKTFDTFAPMGPWIVSADEIEDPHALDISMTIGGEVLQSSNTRELIFKIPDLVSYLSSVFTLEPGDVISTGTPSGVGFARKPPRYLAAGDECVVRVAGIGELRNPVIAEAVSERGVVA
jgi:2-keto-4-pentenoate hydratase/2-oxohepta-3-ene-1,7-dioic acid hydratase in catechol pathway